jgi:photosystem II stability/assembly factor-like uncharacterized protein
VLFVDENTGASDLAMDANNPRVLFAGTWQIDIKTWGRTSGGPGSGLFVSRDEGVTWKRITGHGLPDPPLGKIAVAVAPSDSRRVHALIETGGKGSLWRSDDGGESWRLVNHSRLLNERPHYYTRMLVMPDDPNEVYFPSNGMGVTRDGGETADQVRWGGDNHDMWADPRNANRLMIGNDLGVMISTVRGREWHTMRLPVGQIYHVATDRRVPYFVYGHMQDYASLRGPSNSLSGETIHPSLWTTTAGCETGWNIPDPVDPDVVWGGCYAGVVERFDLRTGRARTVSPWPERTMGANAGQVKLRMNWTFPIAISPHDHEVVYVGSQHVHRTSDGGQTWTTISPDLTLNDPAMMGDSAGLTVDNLSVEYAGVVFAIAESPREKGQIWAGTNDGLLQVTRDGGKGWTNVTPRLPGLPPKGTVGSIEPSRHDPATCYVAIDLHQVDNRDPFVYKTADYGKTWKPIGAGVPKGVLSYAHVVREDPVRRGLLYLGTENGLFVSFDDGARWEPLQNNLPHAPVYGLAVQERFGDLVVATYGRGFWILDDLSVLRQLAPGLSDKDAELFAPRATYRFRTVEAPMAPFFDPVAGYNPPYGAPIHYFLKTTVREKDKDTGKEKEEISITVADASGKTVRTFKGPGKAGLDRAYWDLEFDKTKESRLRTSPLLASHVKVGLEGIPAPGVGRIGLLAPPGTYTVKMKVGERELSQPLTVLRDPGSGASEDDLRAQTSLATDLADDVNRVVDMINLAETLRGQLASLRAALSGESGPKDVRDAAEGLDKKIVAFEENLFQMRVTGRGQDILRAPMKLAEQLVYLAGKVTGSDFAPTASDREVHQILHDQAWKYKAELDQLVGKDLAEFNATLAEKKLTGIVARP